MIEALWKRHYIAGVTGSFHGDMAQTFAKIGRDSDCDLATACELRSAIAAHMRLERLPNYDGDRKWFCELFGTPNERIPS